MIDITQYKGLPYQMAVFHEVVKHGSFTKAADALGHTKSGVSTYVSQLEQSLGVRLLVRSTRKLQLTQTGQQFALRCEALLNLLNVTVEEVHQDALQPQGRFAVTAPLGFDEVLITPQLSILCEHFPKLLPEVTLTDQRLDLLEHHLDLAITVGGLKDSNYNAIQLGSLESIWVISPRLLAKQPIVDRESIANIRLITLPWQIEQFKKESPESEQILINAVPSSISFAKAGLGMLCVPSIFVREAIQEGKLCQVLQTEKPLQANVYAVHAYQKHLPPFMRLFVDLLKAKLSS